MPEMMHRRPLTSADFRQAARRRIPRILFDYIDGGAFGERTMAANLTELERIRLRQRVMRPIGKLALETRLLGETLAMPVLLGPVGFAGMLARRGEVQAAAAAREAGIPFTLSTVGICSVEEVAGAGCAPWFQLYMIRDRDFMRKLLKRAWEAGSRVLVLTIDLPAPGIRYRDMRSGMTARSGLSSWIGNALIALSHPGWAIDVGIGGRPHDFANLRGAFTANGNFASAWAWIRENFDRTIGWSDLDFVRAHWSGRIVVKGILDVEDAREAVANGADAIVVSNHGGRQLDGVASTATKLPQVVGAIGDSCPVLVDGGIRSGLDVLRMLALGARACLLGRAWAFALGAGGGNGVAQMLALMRHELELAMVLTGCADIADAGPALLDRDGTTSAFAHS